MWMGLTSKSTNLATLKTILFVQIIPWLAISFGAGLMMPLVLIPAMISAGPSSPSNFMIWFPLIFAGLTASLAIGKNIGFIVWSRRRLDSRFREQAGPQTPSARSRVPPPLPSAGNAGNTNPVGGN
jgi:hypothetical protein